jgi:hypothetical protein
MDDSAGYRLGYIAVFKAKLRTDTTAKADTIHSNKPIAPYPPRVVSKEGRGLKIKNNV